MKPMPLRPICFVARSHFEIPASWGSFFQPAWWNKRHDAALDVAIKAEKKEMPGGKFMAFLAMVIVVWSVFAMWGEPWETKRATLVTPEPPASVTAYMRVERPMLPDRMPVGSIARRPEQ